MKTGWTKENVISLATLVVYMVGAGIAGYALNIYIKQTEELSKQNKIQIDLSLRNAENELYQMASKDEYLEAFFADPPDKENFSFADAQRYVNLFLDKESFGGWKNVGELTSRVFEPSKNFHAPNKKKLRKAFSIAEHLLYLLQDAHSAYKANILCKADYETWITYVDDIGFNPFFLAALSYGHSSGYITKDFAINIKERLRSSKRNEQAISILYKELQEDDWIDNLGKREYDKYLELGSNKVMHRRADKAVAR
jgi:hypothetical protein